MKQLNELTKEELWQLRQEIVLNSHYLADYENSFEIDEQEVCEFFEGYYDYIWERAKGAAYDEEDITPQIIDGFDNADCLEAWFNCYQD